MTAAIMLLPAQPAVAVTVNKAVWDDGFGYASCTTGVSTRTCVFEFTAVGCTEYAAGGTQVAGCGVRFRNVMSVTPIVQGTKVVGCQADVPAPTWWYGVAFDSTNPLFDNPSIDQHVIVSVRDLFTDGKPGVVTFFAADINDAEGSTSWVAEGVFTASCAPGYRSYTAGGSGSVTARV